ncbi:MAG: hypothetical protein ACOYN0_14155 [Phycisphaerales bacterium]
MNSNLGVRWALVAAAGFACAFAAPSVCFAQKQGAADVKGLPDGLIQAAAPTGPVVFPAAIKKTAKVGDKVTVTGRVGGGAAPFVKDRGVFTIVGEELAACSDSMTDHCAQPWDYCCESKTDVVRNSATIQVNDAKGKLLKVGMKGKGGLKESSEVTVTGTVQAVDEKTLVIVAERIHLAPALPDGWCYNAPPEASKTPGEVRAGAKVGDEVVVRGRIGGRAEPVAPGKASFSLAGPQLPYDESKAKPWAYEGVQPETLSAGVCTVQLVDGNGDALAVELAGRRVMAPGTLVVVTGKVAKREGGELVVNATKVQPEKR